MSFNSLPTTPVIIILSTALVLVSSILFITQLNDAHSRYTIATAVINPETCKKLNNIGMPEAMPELSDDFVMLSKTLWGEARSESIVGQRAIAAVILNRIKSNRFPDTMRMVVTQPNQFSTWNKDDPNYEKINRISMKTMNALELKSWQEILQVTYEALSGDLVDDTGGALYYHRTDVNPFWSKVYRYTITIGVHKFYDEHLVKPRHL